jgi:hypothetical protein
MEPTRYAAHLAGDFSVVGFSVECPEARPNVLGFAIATSFDIHMVYGTLPDEGHAAVQASFVETGHALLVRESLATLRADTETSSTHAAAAPAARTAPSAEPGSRSPSAATSLALHLVLLVVVMSATAVLAMVVSTIVEAVVVAQLTAEGEPPIEERSHHGVGVLTVRPEHHLDALARENS